MKTYKDTVIACCLMVGLNAQAAIINYDGGAAGNDVGLNTAVNWVGDVIPGTSDTGVIHNFDSTTAGTRSNGIGSNRHFQFTGTTFWNVGNSDILTGSSHLEILDSAALKSSGQKIDVINGTVTVDSASDTHTAIDVTKQFKLQGTGTVNHNNGIVAAKRGLQMKDSAVYNLSGGQLKLVTGQNDASKRNFSFEAANYLNFTTGSTGELLWNYDEDMTATFTDRITNGFVRINGAVADVSDFTISYESGVGTTMTIPEPATLGLIALSSFGLLVARRFMEI